MKLYVFAFAVLTLLYISCNAEKTSNAAEELKGVITTVDTFKLYERDEYPLGRFDSVIYKKDADFAGTQLKRLEEIDTASLDETELISWKLLHFVLQNRIDRFTHNMHLNPIQADQGFHLNLNYRIRDINTAGEAEEYLSVLAAIPRFTREHLVLLKEGLHLGLSQPKVIFKNYAPTYDRHIVDIPDSSDFFRPVQKLPSTLSPVRKDSIIAAARELIRDSVVPSFKLIKEFFEEEYIPGTRTTVGISETPGGKSFYQNRIDYYTTTRQYSADDIHQLGLSEVARIRSAMDSVINVLGYEGGLQQFIAWLRTDPQFYTETPESLLMEARDIAKRIDAKLPAYFKTLPRRPYGVKKVPDALAPIYTGGRYSPPSSPTQPGYYLVNTYKLNSRPLYVLPALTAHEAVPGHHLQGSLNRELGDSIPEFRKNLYLSAYGEGWALYTENLAEEMGIYTTPYEYFGKLTYEMWRACRLVVDTGIHAMGWSRQEAVDYLASNTALSMHEVNTEIDRYIAWPGQALSYKMGELKIRELRKSAEEALGENFDIREFHEIILEQGTVTLPILEDRVKDYIKKKQPQTPLQG
ncbi:DUF885 domain-containing protein [Robertkochia aurantiaca]|uniref:DUF885 domain-containing protein n=1 Tax=Robertkochia aurantiaca TaxID=2873700 RepID=UPI001CCA3A01|nr:DUF885 domain-containing protein [Robertkochia sp. 3YJGBD-33]